MKAAADAVRVVLDTNVWLDLLVFDDPRTQALARLLESGQVRALASPPMLDELRAVLDYEHILARCPDPDAMHARACALHETVAAHELPALPQCRDADDQKFLEAAHNGGARLLISKDKALLKMARKIRAFGILAPGAELDRWLTAIETGN